MDGQNSHDLHLSVFPQQPSSSFASSTRWSTKGFIHFSCNHSVTLLKKGKTKISHAVILLRPVEEGRDAFLIEGFCCKVPLLPHELHHTKQRLKQEKL